MAKLYRSREGAVTAVNTKTQLTTLGSETAPGSFLVPVQAKKLVGVIVAASSDLATAHEGAHLIRVEGNGLPEGPESFLAAGIGVQVATGGSYSMRATEYKVDIPVIGGNNISVFGVNTGEDAGSCTHGITLVYEI